jgi:hypothetical protein
MSIYDDYSGSGDDGVGNVYDRYLPHNASVRELNQAVEEAIDRGGRARGKPRPKKKHEKEEVKFHFHAG